MALRSIVTLVRWLGPWADGKVPRGCTVEDVPLDGGRFAGRLFVPPRRAVGAFLVAPGLHHLGPADPRFDRFCRVLAQAGYLVFSPFLPDHCALRLSPRSAGDLGLAFDELERRARRLRLPAPAIFSISFGSLPALALAARPSHAERISSIVLFGGFADFPATVRFVLTGRAEHAGAVAQAPHDPLNAPVVLLHALDELDGPLDRASLAAALRAMVERTWGRPELKLPGARDAIASGLAASLGPQERELFLQGCLLRPGAAERLDEAIRRASARLAFADPRPLLQAIRAPVLIVHGRDDDVIPWIEAHKLRDAMRARHPVETIVTGLYGHTGASRPGLLDLGREAWTLLRVVRALARAPLRLPRVGP